MCGADVRVSGGWGGKCPSVVNDRAYGRRSERDFNVTSRPHAAAHCGSVHSTHSPWSRTAPGDRLYCNPGIIRLSPPFVTAVVVALAVRPSALLTVQRVSRPCSQQCMLRYSIPRERRMLPTASNSSCSVHEKCFPTFHPSPTAFNTVFDDINLVSK